MDRINNFWATFFGLPVDDYVTVCAESGVRVVPHAGLQGYQGAWLFQHGDAAIISVPEEWLPQVKSAVERLPQKGVARPDLLSDLKAVFGDAVEKVIGPAYQGFVDPVDFRPMPSHARLLTSADEAALQCLARSCDPQEWEHSDIHSGQEAVQDPIFGCFVEGMLVAACTYHRESSDAAASGIITHPDYRRRGYGKAVLRAATQHGLDSGFLMLYQTLVANQSAVAVAEGLGYKQHATHYAFRLKNSPPY